MKKLQPMKKVPDFTGYCVSSDGVVYSRKRGTEYRPLSPSTSTGYAHVKLSNGTEKKSYQVHRLVAELFIKNPRKLDIVNHIDGNKLNNSAENLEWVDRKANAKHYETHLAPKQRAARKAKKDSDMKAKISIIHHAHGACTANPELFYSIYKTVMGS